MKTREQYPLADYGLAVVVDPAAAEQIRKFNREFARAKKRRQRREERMMRRVFREAFGGGAA